MAELVVALFSCFVALDRVKVQSEMYDWKKAIFKNQKWAPRNLRIEAQPRVAVVEDVDGTSLEYDPDDITLADRIIERFGGPRRLMASLKAVGCPKNPSTIYKWRYPPPKGRGGLIPTSAWKDILLAARHEGILFTAEDLNPQNVRKRSVKQAKKFPKFHGAKPLGERKVKKYYRKTGIPRGRPRKGMTYDLKLKQWVRTPLPAGKK